VMWRRQFASNAWRAMNGQGGAGNSADERPLSQ
jgi:hypothetical protein